MSTTYLRSADGLAPRAFTFTYSGGTAEAPRTPLVSFSYGPFRIGRKLGEGGYARAMAAQDIASNRLLCLKVFQKNHLKDISTEEVLLNELEVYKRISSSIPCPTTKFIMGLELSFQTKDEICFAMDLMAKDLRTCMVLHPSFCSKNARRWTAQITIGIDALHEMGIIHRDIKSENILLDIRQNVRIADFGLSYIVQAEGPLDRQREYTASVVGTTYCMAPEILHNRFNPRSMKYGAAVDWWSLGCVVFQLALKSHKAIFDTKDDILSYVYWRSSGGRTPEQFSAFESFHGIIADLILGLLHPVPSSRYGFPEVRDHRAFVRTCGASEFSDTYSRALEREEVPMPQYELETHAAEVWHRLAPWEKPRVPNVDWVKPAFFSSL